MMRPRMFRSVSARRTAFSLLELLVVMAIIVIILALVVPAMRGISGGINMTSVAEEVSGSVSRARQRASTFNRQSRMRFYEDFTGALSKSYQIWEKPDIASDPTLAASWKPVEAERAMPAGVTIKKDATHSALLDIYKNLSETKPRGAVKYSEVLFTPSGSLVASSSSAHITIVPEVGPATGGVVAELPPNFAVVVIEPVNSRPTIYRP